MTRSTGLHRPPHNSICNCRATLGVSICRHAMFPCLCCDALVRRRQSTLIERFWAWERRASETRYFRRGELHFSRPTPSSSSSGWSSMLGVKFECTVNMLALIYLLMYAHENREVLRLMFRLGHSSPANRLQIMDTFIDWLVLSLRKPPPAHVVTTW